MDVTEKSPHDASLLSSFQQYAETLKRNQDKYEQIFKIRRDITIEAKRIIFFLHSIDNEKNKEKILNEANVRLLKVIDDYYKKIEIELVGEDPYRFYRAISPANQEFVEALTFLEHLESGNIKGLESTKGIPFIPLIDYILGLGDLTGELMRRCVAALSTGNTADVKNTQQFMQDIYSAMFQLRAGKDFDMKVQTLNQSLLKVERISYNLRLLGKEVPKHKLAIAGCTHDEGFEDCH